MIYPITTKDYILKLKLLLLHRPKRKMIQKGLDKLDKKLSIGILSFSSNRYTYIYSSEEEIECFDFYYINCYDESKTYINGKIII